VTAGIVFEGKKAIGSVVGAGGVAEERFKSVSRIVVTRCIRIKRAAARRRIFNESPTVGITASVLSAA
jgi:hypothetical protein